MELPLRPIRGGFLRAFGCGQFIFEYLSGQAPYGSPVINPSAGAPQADIFFSYKRALIEATAANRAAAAEERSAKSQKRSIDPGNIEDLTTKYIQQMPSKSTGCRYHSFVIYFSTLRRLGWVEKSGHRERSSFQNNYAEAKPRVYYRLTDEGLAAPQSYWANPYAVYQARIA